MTVIEKTRELAEMLKNDPVLVAYAEARKVYDASAELKTKMVEYNTQRAILGQEFSKEVESQSPALLDMVRGRMDELAKEISAMEEYRNFTEAQENVTRLMDEVNREIRKIVFGIDPEEECTHDCSSCHANCPSKQ